METWQHGNLTFNALSYGRERSTHNRKKKIFKNEDSLWDTGDNIKHNNIHIISVPEGEE